MPEMLAFALSTARQAVTSRKGVTAAEYAVLATAIVGAVTAAVLAFKPLLASAFTGLFPTT
jgi:Flp pilus assembly pilin Flp